MKYCDTTHSPRVLIISALAATLFILMLCDYIAFLDIADQDKEAVTSLKIKIISADPHLKQAASSTVATTSEQQILSDIDSSLTVGNAGKKNVGNSDLINASTPNITQSKTEVEISKKEVNTQRGDGATIFDPRLREKLNDLKSKPNKLNISSHIETYEQPDGEVEIRVGNRCFSLRDDESSPTGKQWSLPKRCHNSIDMSDQMALGLKAAMRAKFGSHSSQPKYNSR